MKRQKFTYIPPDERSAPPPGPSSEQLPPNIHNAYWFQGFNAASWQICLGGPLILFASQLGAPAVILGLLAGLSPLTSTLQLVVAPHAERIGYRNLMVKGWTSRVMTLIFLALLPLAAGHWPDRLVIGLLVLIMTAFTTLRGIATCSWLPWTAAIVPRSLRGFYLSRDRTFVSIASVAALTVSGLFLFNKGSMVAFSAVFGISFLAGAISLYFLNRVPDPPRNEEATQQKRSHGAGAPWLSLLQDNAFVRLLIYTAAVQAFVASINTFVIVFMRDQVHLQDGTILWLTAGAALMGTAAMRLLRHRVDRLGSRPFLGIVLIWWVVYFLCWFLLAAGWIGSPWLIAPLLVLLGGFFGATYDLALTRLLMNTVGDRQFSTQYFALHSVSASVVMGISPVVWGLLLDTLRGVQWQAGPLQVNGFALFFAIQWCTLVFVVLAFTILRETSSTSTSALIYRVLVRAPSERLAQLAARDH